MLNYTNQKQTIKAVCFLFILFTVTAIAAHAQIGDPGGGGVGDPDALPIDGGLSLLVAAGIGYGAKKVKENSKKAKAFLEEQLREK